MQPSHLNQITWPAIPYWLKQGPIQSPSQSLDPVTQPGRIHWLKQTVDQVTHSATWPDSLDHLPMVTHQARWLWQPFDQSGQPGQLDDIASHLIN